MDKFVAISVESSEYEPDTKEMKAADRLRKRVAAPQIGLAHVTSSHLNRFGGHAARPTIIVGFVRGSEPVMGKRMAHTNFTPVTLLVMMQSRSPIQEETPWLRR